MATCFPEAFLICDEKIDDGTTHVRRVYGKQETDFSAVCTLKGNH
jgi:hypothetical protein